MSQEIIKLMLQGIQETVFMVAVSTVIAAIIGIPLGITLVTTSKGHILENRVINSILGTIVNVIRSIPFIILMVAIIPLTRIIAGTSIGTTAACVPLTIVAIPFLSRLVETSIRFGRSCRIHGRDTVSNHPQGLDSGSTADYYQQHYRPYCQFNWRIGYGRRYWRRRPWGYCHPLRVSAVPRGRHARYNYHFNCCRQSHSSLRRLCFP